MSVARFTTTNSNPTAFRNTGTMPSATNSSGRLRFRVISQGNYGILFIVGQVPAGYANYFGFECYADGSGGAHFFRDQSGSFNTTDLYTGAAPTGPGWIDLVYIANASNILMSGRIDGGSWTDVSFSAVAWTTGFFGLMNFPWDTNGPNSTIEYGVLEILNNALPGGAANTAAALVNLKAACESRSAGFPSEGVFYNNCSSGASVGVDGSVTAENMTVSGTVSTETADPYPPILISAQAALEISAPAVSLSGPSTYTLVATQAALETTANTTALAHGFQVVPGAVSLEVDSVDVGFSTGFFLVATQHALGLHANTVGLTAQRLLTATQHALGLHANTVNPLRGLLLTATQRAMGLTSATTALARGLLLTSTQRSLLITAATINPLRSEVTVQNLSAMSLTASTIGVLRGVVLQSTQAALDFDANDTTFSSGNNIVATQANLRLTAPVVNLGSGNYIAPDPHLIRVTSTNVGLLRAIILQATQAGLDLTGVASVLSGVHLVVVTPTGLDLNAAVVQFEFFSGTTISAQGALELATASTTFVRAIIFQATLSEIEIDSATVGLHYSEDIQIGVLANSASMTHAFSTGDSERTGYVCQEPISLLVSVIGSSYEWSMSAPETSGPHAEIRGVDQPSALFIPDVAGYYVVSCLVDGAVAYILRILVSDVVVGTEKLALGLQSKTDGQIPEPSAGLILYCSSTQGGSLCVKDAEGAVLKLDISAV